MAFFDNVAQLTANPLAMMENTKPGCTAFETGNGSLQSKRSLKSNRIQISLRYSAYQSTMRRYWQRFLNLVNS